MTDSRKSTPSTVDPDIPVVEEIMVIIETYRFTQRRTLYEDIKFCSVHGCGSRIKEHSLNPATTAVIPEGRSPRARKRLSLFPTRPGSCSCLRSPPMHRVIASLNFTGYLTTSQGCNLRVAAKYSAPWNINPCRRFRLVQPRPGTSGLPRAAALVSTRRLLRTTIPSPDHDPYFTRRSLGDLPPLPSPSPVRLTSPVPPHSPSFS